MSDGEVIVAGKVHALLLSAGAEADEEALAKAAELASPIESATAQHGDDFRAGAVSAIDKVRGAIADGASLCERKRLLQNAVYSVHSWLNARRFSNQH